jgi:antitoxin PrlF
MPIATVTSKGQITVPQAVRRALGLHAGTKVDFVPVVDGFKVVPLHEGHASGLKGRFAGRATKAVSIEAMNEAIAAEASRRHARGDKR